MTHRQYFNTIAADWNNMDLVVDEMAQLVRRMKIRSGDIILDVGAGTGQLSLMISQCDSKPAMIFQLDSAQQMLFYGQEKHYDCNVCLLAGDAHWLPFDASIFNQVICFQVFPHLQNATMALQQFHYVLVDRGRLTIAHLTGSDLVNQIHAHIGWPVCQDILPRVGELARLLENTGFNILMADESDRCYFIQAEKM